MSSIAFGNEQYTMRRDWYQLALLEWKRTHPHQRRESDLSNEDREWIQNRAAEMEASNG